MAGQGIDALPAQAGGGGRCPLRATASVAYATSHHTTSTPQPGGPPLPRQPARPAPSRCRGGPQRSRRPLPGAAHVARCRHLRRALLCGFRVRVTPGHKIPLPCALLPRRAAAAPHPLNAPSVNERLRPNTSPHRSTNGHCPHLPWPRVQRRQGEKKQNKRQEGKKDSLYSHAVATTQP